MSLDILELLLCIGREFGRGVNREALLAGALRQFDGTAGELLELVGAHPACNKCDYDLRGHKPGNHCPECGRLFPGLPPNAWEKLQRILAEVATTDRRKVDPASITPSTRLVADLGLT